MNLHFAFSVIRKVAVSVTALLAVSLLPVTSTQAQLATNTDKGFVPEISSEGVVTIPLQDVKNADEFNPAIRFSGDIKVRNVKPNGALLPGGLQVKGPALVLSGPGEGEATIEFAITANMDKLRFYVLGNSDRSSIVALYIDGREWSRKGIETDPKKPELTEWKLNSKEHAGKKAKLSFAKGAGPAYLALVSKPEAVITVDRPAIMPKTVVPYHVESEFIKRVNIVLTTSYRCPEDAKGQKYLEVFFQRPPSLKTQQLLDMSFRCIEYPRINAVETRDYINTNHTYLCIRIPANSQTVGRTFHFEGQYAIDLYRAKIKRGPDTRKNAVMLLTEGNDPIYLQESSKSDFNNLDFKKFIITNGLIKGEHENTTDFAYRVYRFMYVNGKAVSASEARARFVVANEYINGKTVPAFEPLFPKASRLCAENPLLFGGCGDTASFFAAVMGYNKIPCMTNSGRWANSSTEDNPQFHVRSSFYATENGDWTEMDATLGVCSKNDLYFREADNFITLTSYLECMPVIGGQKIIYFQSTIGTFTGRVLAPAEPDSWRVETVR